MVEVRCRGALVLQYEPEEKLRFLLESYSKDDGEFWSFRDRAMRQHTHVYFQYPAMMVPQMQSHLIQAVKEAKPTTMSIFDPFVGSGTTMTEAMMQGLDFTGYDINPLAILICRAKIGPFCEKELHNQLLSMMKFIKEDKMEAVDVHFQNQDKWFQPKISMELSKIRRAIREEEQLWCRRFFWVALAETVRLTSNSRTSTFKLHIRPQKEIEKREKEISPITVFEDIATRNLNNLVNQKKLLEEHGLLEGGYYRGNIDIKLVDSVSVVNHDKLHDLLITSPPYGDNLTTVPYGQHSYLPLWWIDLKDVDVDVSKEWLKTTHEIDHRSIGGSLAEAFDNIDELCNLSKSFSQLVDDLKNEPKDRLSRVAAFYRDLNRSLDTVLAALRPNAYMVWTVGSRRVANKSIPIDSILSELLAARGANNIMTLQRKIPTKRMALRNRVASTMHSETVLIMRKGNS